MQNKNKKIVIISVLIVVIGGFAYIFANCMTLNIRAVVVKSGEKHLTVMELKSETLYDIFLSNDNSLQFKQGQEILIKCRYGTIIEQSLPASIREQYIKKVKIIKEKSDIEISDKILAMNYNSEDKIFIYIDEISTTGISLTIKDTNEYKQEYEYSTDYKIVKMNSSNTYDVLTKKINTKETVNSIKVDNNTFKNTYNWENVYGKLESGKYRFNTLTMDIYINLFIDFTVDANGNITYDEPACVIF